MFWAGKNLLPKLKAQIEGSRELMLLSGLAWGLGFAVLFEKVGFSVEIGALLAGMSIAGLPFSGEIGVRLKPLRDFFIVIFFVSLGYGMDVGKIPGVMVPAVILSLIVVLVKPFVVMANMGMSGYTKKASFKASVALAQVSEFSLVFMLSAFGAGLVTERAINTLTVVALITFLSSTYMMKYDDELFSLLENKLRVFERRVTNQEQKHLQNNYPIVMFGYRKGGSEFVKTFEKMGKKFVVVDYDPEVVELIDRKGLNLIYGDAVDAEVMEEVGLENSKLIVSNIHDLHTNALLLSWLEGRNPKAVFICSADSAEEAIELYAKGAAYVVMPHMVGSEKMGSFLQKNNLSKAEFKRSRERHLRQIEKYYAELKEDDDSSGLNP
jgi:Trk K+ transport system NAD-binding subunit